MSVYETLNIRTYINAVDPLASYGCNLLSEGVLDAMEEASRSFVRMEDLHRAVGERIAEMTQNEGAAVVAGTAAGLMMCAAALMTGGDYERMMSLPDAPGLKREILVLKAQMDAFGGETSLVGAKLVPVDAGPRQKEKLRAAINDNTCAIFYAVVRTPNTLTFEEVAEVAKRAHVPLVVNAMSQIPPKESLWRFTKAGAEAAVFAGGRALCGPASSGFIVGKKWLTDAVLSIAPPKHSIASVANIGREEVVGLYVALEEYLAGDDFAAKIRRAEDLLRDLRHRMEKEGYFLCRRACPGPFGQNYPYMVLEILGAYSAEALVEMLAKGDPAILVRRTSNEDCENGIYINLVLLTDEQVEIVLRRVVECAEKLTLMNKI
ncbi:MAG: hypothetical protein ACOX83_02515 [Candidatus Spyradocola sp.]